GPQISQRQRRTLLFAQDSVRRQMVGGQRIEAPFGHITERWRRLVFEGRKSINPNLYEAAAFEAVKDGLRSGNMYVVGSRRCQNFESYLISRERWNELLAEGQTRLALTGTADEYIESRRVRISE